jgi:hypothetical protein
VLGDLQTEIDGWIGLDILYGLLAKKCELAPRAVRVVSAEPAQHGGESVPRLQRAAAALHIRLRKAASNSFNARNAPSN